VAPTRARSVRSASRRPPCGSSPCPPCALWYVKSRNIYLQSIALCTQRVYILCRYTPRGTQWTHGSNGEWRSQQAAGPRSWRATGPSPVRRTVARATRSSRSRMSAPASTTPRPARVASMYGPRSSR
jgi:hypothetical protein